MRFGEIEPSFSPNEWPALEEKVLAKSEKLARCTSTFIETIIAIRITGCPEAEAIWNSACHLNILSHDLNVLVYPLAVTRSLWLQRALARMIILAMYEGCDDLLELFGASFKDACEKLEIAETLEDERRTVCRRLSRFRKQHVEHWKSVRLNAAAHRDHDALEVLKAIANLSPGDTAAESKELDDILRDFGAFAGKAMEAAEIVCRKRGIIPDVDPARGANAGRAGGL
jgi:hypothetical protein